MAGVAALYTGEFGEAARARLRPGGVFCQWAHTYEIAEQDLRSIVRTFAAVFPQGTMWLVGESDLLLIGSPSGNVDSGVAGVAERSRLGSVPALLADVGVPASAAPFVPLSLFAGGPAGALCVRRPSRAADRRSDVARVHRRAGDTRHRRAMRPG
jgi:spermidine synthase